MERLLHYVWKYKLYAGTSLRTTAGLPLSVIDPGVPNTDAGPDFFNAKIRIADTLWAGNVEIHDRASDWAAHRHGSDRAYDSVILHVVGVDDASVCRPSGEPIPQLVLVVPEAVRRDMDWLLSRDTPFPCLYRAREVDPVHVASWMDALLGERLERKTADLLHLLDRYRGDWEEAFYVTLARAFGFGLNADAFEWLARSLPLRYVRKHRASQTQVEALFFGQAGMLAREVADPYHAILRREYAFLRHKFGLHPIDGTLFKRLRLRPGMFPQIRLAQLSALWYRYDALFSRVLDAPSPRAVKDLLRVEPSAFWTTHYRFDQPSVERPKAIGESSLDLLLINAVVPALFAYGQRHGLLEYADRAVRLLKGLPPERNRVVGSFLQAGFPARDAADTQALIQLRRAYCEPRKCLYCRVGFRLLKMDAARR